MSECDCPLKGESYRGDRHPRSCNEESPDGTLWCSKPVGHDGPHAGCNPTEHPVEVWDR